MAKVSAVLKSNSTVSHADDDTGGIVRAGALTIDTFGLTVTADGEKNELTAKEFALLMLFVNNKGAVLSRERIFNEVWGYEAFGVDRTVDWQVKLLRGKLGPCRDCIKTVRGVGYKFEA